MLKVNPMSLSGEPSPIPDWVLSALGESKDSQSKTISSGSRVENWVTTGILISRVSSMYSKWLIPITLLSIFIIIFESPGHHAFWGWLSSTSVGLKFLKGGAWHLHR